MSTMTKLSKPMQDVLLKLGAGWGWDDFGVHGPLSHAARVRTCNALAKRGLVRLSLGDYDLTEAGAFLASQLKDQVNAAEAASEKSPGATLTALDWSQAPDGTTHVWRRAGDEPPVWLRVQDGTVYWKTPRRCKHWIPSPSGLGELRKPGVEARPSM